VAQRVFCQWRWFVSVSLPVCVWWLRLAMHGIAVCLRAGLAVVVVVLYRVGV
jgi:hypothetical protein